MKLEVIRSFGTLAGVIYSPGDILELIEPTGRNPFNVKLLENHSWLVKCPFFSPPHNRSVWCHLSYGLEKGLFKVIK